MTTWGFSDAQMAALSTSDEDCDRMITLARACGVSLWRIPADWAACEPSPTQRNWVSVDRQISRLKNAGITPLIVIGGSRPKYSQFSQFGFGTEVGPSEFAAFCTDVATRYGTTTGPYGKVCTDFEIWTDPNNGGSWGDVVNAVSYVAYLQPAYTAIKAVTGLSGLNSRVVFGGTQHVTTVDSTWLTQSETDFVSAAYTAGAHGYFDVMGVHPFTDVDGLTAPSNSSPALLGNDAIHALMVANGDGAKPIWWTALGYSTSDFTPANQATYISTMFTLASTRSYVQRLFVQALVDTSADPQNRTGNYGVVAIDWSLKPAYGYLQALNPYYRAGTLTGHGGFTATAEGFVIGGTLTGHGGFAGIGLGVVHTAGTLTGHGGFSGTGAPRYARTGTLTGVGGFTGFEASSGRSGTLTGAGGFTATGKARYTRTGTMAGSGSFTGSALARYTRTGTMAGSGSFTSTVTSRTNTSGTLTGHGNYTGTGVGHSVPTIAASLNSGTFASSRTVSTGTITSWTPQTNDVVVLLINLPQSSPVTFTLPTGWLNALGGTTVATSPAGATMVAVYHQVTSAEATAATTSWTLTNLLDTAKQGHRVVFVVRGTDPTTPIGTTAVTGGSSATYTSPTITPTKSLSLVTAGGGGNSFSTSTTFTAPSAPWSTITGSLSGTNLAFALQCSTSTTAGVAFTGVSLSISRTEDWPAVTIAFAAA